VFVLGLGAILLSANLPKSVDGVMQHVVGATLILLGLYVVYAVAKHGPEFRMRSRWMLVLSGLRRSTRWARSRTRRPVVITHEHEHRLDEAHADVLAHDRVPLPATASAAGSHTHSHPHRHVAATPDDPFMNYGKATSFGIGMIHGIGAETPTQVIIFLTAAGAGGKAAGTAVLACFLVGLLCSNTAVAVVSTFGYGRATRSWKVYRIVSLVTAVFSVVVGAVFLTGNGSLLSAMFGG